MDDVGRNDAGTSPRKHASVCRRLPAAHAFAVRKNLPLEIEAVDTTGDDGQQDVHDQRTVRLHGHRELLLKGGILLGRRLLIRGRLLVGAGLLVARARLGRGPGSTRPRGCRRACGCSGARLVTGGNDTPTMAVEPCTTNRAELGAVDDGEPQSGQNMAPLLLS